MKLFHVILWLVILTILTSTPLLSQQVRGNLGRGYVTIYDTKTKKLVCVSQNKGAEWRNTVAENVPSIADFSGAATAAGPIFVYTSGSTVNFVLFRWQKGSTNAEKSGESLRGGISSGRLLSASWQIGSYGAKVTIETLSGNTVYTTKRDINMWGNGKELSRSSRTIQVKRVQVPGSKLSFEEPPWFTSRWDASSTSMGIMPTNSIPMGLMITLGEAGVNLPEFADIVMRDIGPAMGAPDLKMVANQNVSVGGRMPGLLRIANGTMNGKAATFAFVFFEAPGNTVVLVYATRSENYDTYANIFYRFLSSVRVG